MYYIKHDLNKQQLINSARKHFKTSDVEDVIESKDGENFDVIFGCSYPETVKKDTLNKVILNDLPKNTYFSVGFNTPKGTAFLYTFSEEQGTYLTPIYESKTNELHTNAFRAGESIKTGESIQDTLTKL